MKLLSEKERKREERASDRHFGIRKASRACFDAYSVNFGEHAGVAARLAQVGPTMMVAKRCSHSPALRPSTEPSPTRT